MKDFDGIEVTSYEDGCYFYKEKDGMHIIEIDDDQAYFIGDEVGVHLEELEGKLIEKITWP